MNMFYLIIVININHTDHTIIIMFVFIDINNKKTNKDTKLDIIRFGV